MLKTRVRILIGALIPATALTLIVGTGPAQATPQNTRASTSVAASTTFGTASGQVASAAEQQAVLDYWTPEKMAAAQPLDLVGVRPEQTPIPASTEPARQTEPAAAAIKLGPAQVANPVTNWSRTNGRLFITTGNGATGWCSASALNTSSKRVVITAGHCVYDQSHGGWMRNLVFVPGYDGRLGDKEPVGRFTASRMRTFNAWINNGNHERDVAMVTLNNGGDWGQRVVDTVGGHGLTYGGARSGWDFSHFGYPMNRNNGEVMWACWGRTTLWRVYPTVNCNFLGGSSGGPWLFQYNNSSGLGYVRGVTSFGRTATDPHSMSPYFDSAVKSMMDATSNDV